MSPEFWQSKRVFLTGHTGFKGSWLSLWLLRAGAQVSGYSLAPFTNSSLFDLTELGREIHQPFGDLRDLDGLKAAMLAAEPEIVLHLGAQALVQEGYRDPAGTFASNLMGTVNLLEAVRSCPTVKAVLVVSSDKCYQPHLDGKAHLEDDSLGGLDPYSASKSCTEIAAHSFRHSYWKDGSVALASARAGNVVGGGDFSAYRLVPDLIRAFAEGQPLNLRYPHATRPWQHVLEPIAGYLRLVECIWEDPSLVGPYNFGPNPGQRHSVLEVVRLLEKDWGRQPGDWPIDPNLVAETILLELDSSKARQQLGWQPQLSFEECLQWTSSWHRKLKAGAAARDLCLEQIDAYSARL